MSDQTANEPKINKAELLERLQRAETELNEILSPLSPEQLARQRASGWAIKDHLAHLATWELGMAELLQHHNRFAAMGVADAVAQDQSEAEINDRIYRQNAHLTPEQAQEKLRQAHAQMVRAIQALSDADLYKPYAAYLPAGEFGPQAPVINWIIGNSSAHYAEHEGYIRKELGE